MHKHYSCYYCYCSEFQNHSMGRKKCTKLIKSNYLLILRLDVDWFSSFYFSTFSTFSITSIYYFIISKTSAFKTDFKCKFIE